MVHKYFIILLSSLFLISCSSGKSSLDRGDYDLAVYQAVKRLQQKPDHQKAKDVLRKAYKMAVDRHLDNVKAYDISQNSNKWELMTREYESINHLNNVIKSYPDYARVIELVDVSEQLAQTRQQAAQELINRGKMYMEQGTKEAARLAYYEFELAETFSPGNPEILELLLTAKEAGTVNIAVEFPENTAALYYLPSTDLYHEIKNEMVQLNYRFMRVISADHPFLEADEVVQLSFQDIYIGYVHVDRSTEQMIKDGVVLGEEQVNDSTTREIKGKVKATFTHYVKTINSSAELLVRRIDTRSGDILVRRRFPSTFNWMSEWGSYNGDSRALNKQQLSLCDLTEAPAPNRAWIFDQLCAPIYNDVVIALRREYAYLR